MAPLQTHFLYSQLIRVLSIIFNQVLPTVQNSPLLRNHNFHFLTWSSLTKPITRRFITGEIGLAIFIQKIL